jgi:aspartate aminotransferase-like enzyme
VAALHCENPKEVISKLRERGYVIAGGMYKYREKSIRIGVMGDISMDDLKKVVDIINNVAR